MVTKVELKKELKRMGIPVMGNFVKRSDLKKAISAWSDYEEQILAGYLEAIIFTERDEMDSALEGEFADEVKDQAKKDITIFTEKAEKAGVELTQYDTETIGHDLWLTRNGHGSGFWDGDYEGNDGQDGDTLTKIAKSLGERSGYVGDDGKIYLG